MNSSKLTELLLDKHFITPNEVGLAIVILDEYISRKGEEAVTESIRSRRTRFNNINKYLPLFLEDLPDIELDQQPIEEDIVLSIEEEIQIELNDIEEAKELKRAVAAITDTKSVPFAEANDPRFDESPSVFDGPYRGHEEYRSNTYMSVYREAKKANTSMHEICRRKGLNYDLLIM